MLFTIDSVVAAPKPQAAGVGVWRAPDLPVCRYEFSSGSLLVQTLYLPIQTTVVLDITACGNVTDISRAARGILGVIRSRNSRCSHGEVCSAAPVQLVEDFPTQDPTLHCCNLIYGSFNTVHISWVALGSLSPFLGDFICNGSLRWMCGSC